MYKLMLLRGDPAMSDIYETVGDMKLYVVEKEGNNITFLTSEDGISFTDAKKKAIENADYKLYSFHMIGIPYDTPMVIATTAGEDIGNYGAAAIMDPKIQAEAESIFGGSFYVLPSSVHECILVRNDGDKEKLKKLVREINGRPDCIQPHEALSYCVLEYAVEDKAYR